MRKNQIICFDCHLEIDIENAMAQELCINLDKDSNIL